MSAPAPSFNYNDYRELQASIAQHEPEEWFFKSDEIYTQVLEHDFVAWAEEHLAVARETSGDDWANVYAIFEKTYAENDSLGHPHLDLIPSLGIKCSTSNLRYLSHALLILKHLHGPSHIVEIGGGYGGLALYIQRLAALFDIDILSYTSIDLPEAVVIQSKFAEMLGFPLRVINGLDEQEMKNIFEPNDTIERFLVSIYAFAEFDQVMQNWYIEQVIPKCEHGLLIWNYNDTWSHRPPNPLYAFTEKTLRVEAERPLTNSYNLLVTF